MVEIVFPDTPSHEAVFQTSGTKKGLSPKVITSRAVLGEPAAVPIRESTLGDDIELKRFFAAQKAQWGFHAVQLRCTFAAGEGETFERATVTVQLSAENSGSGRTPMAWSMSPFKLAQKIKTTQSDSIGADLKLLNSKLGYTVEVPDNQLYVIAYNEQCANPYWYLKAVPGITIEGVERFSMIVRIPRGSKAAGQLSVAADILARRFGGLIICTAAVPNVPQLSFSL